MYLGTLVIVTQVLYDSKGIMPSLTITLGYRVYHCLYRGSLRWLNYLPQMVLCFN